MAVLIGMSAPYFGRALEQARADFAAANLRAIWAAERLYWLENHAYTNMLTQTSPMGLVELGLLDPGIVSTSGDYTYSLSSTSSNAFTAQATRSSGTPWTGSFTIDQNGTIGGAVSGGTTVITPGFQ
jgi:hypothetical protein